MSETEETGPGQAERSAADEAPTARPVDISCGRGPDASGQLPAAPRCQMRSILSGAGDGAGAIRAAGGLAGRVARLARAGTRGDAEQMGSRSASFVGYV